MTAGAGLPSSFAVSVALRRSRRCARTPGRHRSRLGLHFHQTLGGLGEHVVDKALVGGLLHQFHQGHSVVGHRRLRFGSRVATRTYSEDRRWPPASPPAARCATPVASRVASFDTTYGDRLASAPVPTAGRAVGRFIGTATSHPSCQTCSTGSGRTVTTAGNPTRNTAPGPASSAAS